MRRLIPAAILIGIVACRGPHSDEGGAEPAAEMPGAAGAAAAPTLGPHLATAGAISARSAPPAPPLRGRGEDEGAFDLAELRGRRVLLIFYRSATCGLCIQQLKNLSEAAEAYDKFDAEIIALTADPPEVNRRTAEILELGFPIVSVDIDTMVSWGVWPAGSTRPHPAAFIIDEEGRIRFVQVGRTAADRASDVTLIFNLRSLDQSATDDSP